MRAEHDEDPPQHTPHFADCRTGLRCLLWSCATLDGRTRNRALGQWRRPTALQHAELDRERTWSDHTTHAIHEDQTLRIERVHEAGPRDTAWTVAAYETPVSERMWQLTATGTTPEPVLQTLLTHLADGDASDTALGSPITDKTVTAATKPLTDAGWTHTVDGRWIRWTNPSEDAGVQFDAFAAQNPNSPLDTWTIWAGTDVNNTTWAIRASVYTPAALLADLTEELAHGTGTRQVQPGREPRTRLATSAPATPAVTTGHPASRSR
ncbi:DUF317 domain-containing protein [Streptomyces sp. NPDC001980]|uniref:DUF317 domain-containing protein n=1 Tax=Streptomyces sp. NPDC001980 TaxID=3157126 RepID=UPI0033208076